MKASGFFCISFAKYAASIIAIKVVYSEADLTLFMNTFAKMNAVLSSPLLLIMNGKVEGISDVSLLKIMTIFPFS